jgi:hypothetical protein
LRFSFECDPQTAAGLKRSGHALERLWSRVVVRGLVVLAGLMLLVWLRCPTILTRATFWGEDGWVWYPTCYTAGWHCLQVDIASYLQTTSMLIALLSQPLPFAVVPTFFAFAALIIQAAPAAFLISGRMAEAVPSLPARVLLALLIVSMPGMSEVYVNVTNAQWHLAVLSFMLLMATVPAGWPGRVFDSAILVVSGLSGPFSVFLTPVAWIWWISHRKRWTFWRALIVTGTALVQLRLILLHGQVRSAGGPGIGVNLHDFNRIFLNDVAVATVGWHSMLRNAWGPGHGWLYGDSTAALVVSTLLVLAALGLLLVAFIRGRWVLRCFLIFVALEYAAMLVDGLAVDKQPLWAELASSLANRYSFHPILAWLAVLVALLCDRSRWWRSIAAVIFASVVLFAVAGDYKLAPLAPTDFVAKAHAFAHAPSGTVMHFPTRPMFYMTLTKK